MSAADTFEVTLSKPSADAKLGLVLSTSDEVPELHISLIRPGSLAAATAVLQEGDRILEVNGAKVEVPDDANVLMKQAMRQIDRSA